MNKSELLNWLREEYQGWEALLDQIGPARMDQPGVNGDWSMKDIVAHLTGWQPRLTTRIQAAQRGEPEPPPPWPAHLEAEDDINAWIYESNRGRSVREVLDESRQVFQQLLAAIEGLPDEVRIEIIQASPDREFYLVWLGEERFPAGEFFDHFHDDHEPDVRPGWRVWKINRCSMNIITWRTIIWQQFGAAFDMLDNALRACPDQLWRESVWIDPTDAPEYGEFWFIVSHTLVWLDRYLSGSPEGFAPPAPFVAGSLPEKPYTRDELQAYLGYCREKCRVTFEALTDERANQNCKFPWGEEVSFAELQLYNMRHVQEHAAQLSLHLGHKVGSAPDWVPRAENRTT